MEKAKVYFTREITPEAVIRVYELLGKELPGKVAVKVHSGEKGNQNYLRPQFMRPMVEAVKGTVVECNTAYDGARNSTEKHKMLMAEHGWSRYFQVDLLDGEGPDLVLSISGGKVLKENYVGKNMANYDSMLVLSHFKGHPMGGYGGALKQLSIGCASSAGKCLIHSGGATDDQNIVWSHVAEQDAVEHTLYAEHRHAHRLRPVGHKAAGNLVDLVVQALYGGGDFLPVFRQYVSAVQEFRDSGQGEARFFFNILDRCRHNFLFSDKMVRFCVKMVRLHKCFWTKLEFRGILRLQYQNTMGRIYPADGKDSDQV